MLKSVSLAIGINEEGGSTTSSLVDDVFYILQQCSRRASETRKLLHTTPCIWSGFQFGVLTHPSFSVRPVSIQAICAVLNHANLILTGEVCFVHRMNSGFDRIRLRSFPRRCWGSRTMSYIGSILNFLRISFRLKVYKWVRLASAEVSYLFSANRNIDDFFTGLPRKNQPPWATAINNPEVIADNIVVLARDTEVRYGFGSLFFEKLSHHLVTSRSTSKDCLLRNACSTMIASNLPCKSSRWPTIGKHLVFHNCFHISHLFCLPCPKL